MNLENLSQNKLIQIIKELKQNNNNLIIELDKVTNKYYKIKEIIKKINKKKQELNMLKNEMKSLKLKNIFNI